MASGTTVLDFGAFPGSKVATAVVTGQTGIGSGSLVQAELRPVDSADHGADEHLVVDMIIRCGNIIAGTGFTIYGFDATPEFPGGDAVDGTGTVRSTGGGGMLHGQWNVFWVWV